MGRNIKKYLLLLFLLSAFACKPEQRPGEDNGKDEEEQLQGEKKSDITYQLLVYSFADSDGDGIGDFNGITRNLDYIDRLGATAIWLSPIHPSASYHGYDVKDYSSVNPLYGTEQDFKNLVSAARSKNIKIYLDYVLNHSSKEHPWFKEAVASETNPYKDYYVLSGDPQADIAAGKIPSIATEGTGGYQASQWYTAPGQTGLGAKGKFKFRVDWNNASAPKVTVSSSSEPAQSSNSDNAVSKYLYFGEAKLFRLYDKGGNIYEIIVDFDSSWGFLLRTSSTKWDGGTKFGAPSGGKPVKMGEEYQLTNSPDCQDCTFKSALKYHSHFWTDWFADFNYGPSFEAHKSPAFKALASAADQWIGMGVAGLRLDAVKHIYHNAYTNENPEFLKQWYERCNSAYKAAGHAEDFYMVGEMLDDASKVAPYYKGLPAFFEFSYWYRLSWAIKNKTGRYFSKDILEYREKYKNYREESIASIKLSNHDEDRAASVLGRNLADMKLAASVLLTSGGQPYIYQGEELGYFGTKSNGDEFVRTPIMWDAAGYKVARKGLNGKVDDSMLEASISVESQLKEPSSLLRLYRKLGRLRNTYKALAKGVMSKHPVYNEGNDSFNSIAAWYMTYQEEKMLVIHNFGNEEKELTLADKTSSLAFSNGKASLEGEKLSLGAKSSAVFLLR